MKEARVACDKAYTELEAVINSLLVLAPSAAFSQWVAVQNEDIDRMKLVFKKHKKRAADESESELNDSLLTEEKRRRKQKRDEKKRKWLGLPFSFERQRPASSNLYYLRDVVIFYLHGREITSQPEASAALIMSALGRM